MNELDEAAEAERRQHPDHPEREVVGVLGVHAGEDEGEEESIHAGTQAIGGACAADDGADGHARRRHSTGRAGRRPCSARSWPMAASKSSSDSNAWYTLAKRR